MQRFRGSEQDQRFRGSELRKCRCAEVQRRRGEGGAEVHWCRGAEVLEIKEVPECMFILHADEQGGVQMCMRRCRCADV